MKKLNDEEFAQAVLLISLYAITFVFVEPHVNFSALTDYKLIITNIFMAIYGIAPGLLIGYFIKSPFFKSMIVLSFGIVISCVFRVEYAFEFTPVNIALLCIMSFFFLSMGIVCLSANKIKLKIGLIDDENKRNRHKKCFKIINIVVFAGTMASIVVFCILYYSVHQFRLHTVD